MSPMACAPRACETPGCARRRGRVVACAMSLSVFPASATAQIAYFFQFREVRAYTGMGPVIGQAPDFGPWSAMVESLNPPPEPNYARTEQTSRLDPDRIVMSSYCFGEDFVLGGGQAIALSTLDVRFTIGATTQAVARHTTAMSGSGGNIALFGEYWLTALTTPPTSIQHTFLNGTREWIHTLTPGDYRLQVTISGGWTSTGAGWTENINDFVFLVPAPGGLAVLGLALPMATRRRRG